MESVSCMTRGRCQLEFYRDTERYDQKYNGCGITYKIGTHLFDDRLIWMNRPFKDGANNDKGNFVKHGLMDKLKEIVKKALGEKIHNGHPNKTIIFNAFDCDAVAEFKARAQMRHKKFNGKMKDFFLMQVKFRSTNDENVAAAFETIAVLVQYRLEHGEYLFDILAGIEAE